MNLVSRTIYRGWVVPALRIIVGGVFVYAGWAKTGDPAAFADSVASFRLLPPALDNLMALGLPPFEILLGLLLAAGWRRRTMAFGALLVCGVFCLALVSAWIRRLPVDCGCFGPRAASVLSGTRPWVALGRDLLLMLGAAVVYVDAWPWAEPDRVRADAILEVGTDGHR